jgi:hypothetical protein
VEHRSLRELSSRDESQEAAESAATQGLLLTHCARPQIKLEKQMPPTDSVRTRHRLLWLQTLRDI